MKRTYGYGADSRWCGTTAWGLFGRVERLLKRFLMLVGVTTLLYIMTYNYHLFTVNIVSRNVNLVQGYHIQDGLTETDDDGVQPELHTDLSPEHDDKHVAYRKGDLGPEVKHVAYRKSDLGPEVKHMTHRKSNLGPEAAREGRLGMQKQVKSQKKNNKKGKKTGIREQKGLDKLALEDPNHPDARRMLRGQRLVQGAGDEGYEGGDEVFDGGEDEQEKEDEQEDENEEEEDEDEEEEEAEEDTEKNEEGGKEDENGDEEEEEEEGNNDEIEHQVVDADHNGDENVKLVEKSESQKGRSKKSKNRSGKFVNAKQTSRYEHALRKHKLQILNLKLQSLRDEVAGLHLVPMERPENSTSRICTRYRREGNIKHRHNVTNIWSAISQIELEDITFVTQMTLKRIGILARVATHWTGPINVAVYTKREELSNFTEFVSQYPVLLDRKNIEMHVVVEHGEFYPVNFLRNVALNNTVTRYVYLSDVDFVPSIGLHDNLKNRIAEGLLSNKTVLVVPGFQFSRAPVTYFPQSKKELLTLWRKKVVKPFHWYFKFGHRATNFGRWRKTTEPYYVNWEDGFEPYILGERKDMPKYRQKLLARVRNKTSQITELYYMGFWFKVLPDVFTIHFPHKTVKKGNYYYRCSLNAYTYLKKYLKRRYPTSKYRARGKPVQKT